MVPRSAAMVRTVSIALVVLLAGPPIAYALFLASLAFGNHEWFEMDWDGDGRVTLPEIVEGADVGRRSVLVQGRACTEFFTFKDGLPIRTDCPG
jgi:hypothetical protein